ncbi:metal ABC transporter solute-binding protein, Zn/Mn family [Williamsia sterculiae]|uniref:Zinc/manganese transport system substrate-binding protein n=1 Tax=Williamsia sterculiae TaxID=1344003 RepID=A0A1N7CUL8_9NOCA|nr:zinc ABC transporter substrate-binding protein [Williamsia sterculiae]SIR67240.1 zinc/manganese transport system substrate-binding protein [Williamsia sterculiae]
MSHRLGRGRLVAVTSVAAVAAIGLAACGSDDSGGSGAAGGSKPTLVTSTDVWGSVAKTVAGDNATVTALFTSPDGDPHEFTPSAKDTATIADADVVLLNGGHYDQYMEDAPKGSANVIDAFDLLGANGRPGQVNEHVFYDLELVGGVAQKVADALSQKDSAHAAAYKANAAAFETKIDGLRTAVAKIKAAHDGAKVAQTEPLAYYLLDEAGLKDATPSGFEDAVEGDQTPSAADIAATEDLIGRKQVRALLYNAQAVDDTTEQLLSRADTVKLPVVQLTETLPRGVTDYIAWQQTNIDAIGKAVAS